MWGGAAKLPFVGIARAAADYDIGMNLKVLMEIEDSGKVVSSYLFDEKILIRDKVTDQAAMAETYRNLVNAYRIKFFWELDRNFVNRYF